MEVLENYGLNFGKPKIVMTRVGEREVRSAAPTKVFWEAWRANKEVIKKAGFSVAKGSESGDWEVSHWSQTMSKQDREANTEASRAVDAAIAIPVPDGLEYLPFQKGGISYALQRPGTLIGDEMGLGKTIQAIGFANAVGARRILVVAPASLLSNWRNEICKWQTLGLPVTIIRPGRSTFSASPGWYIINYDVVSRYDEELKRNQWDLAVYDECQYMKSARAKRTIALLGGGKGENKREPVNAKRTLMLTGTPIMNRPIELYPILHHLDSKRWASVSTFGRRYCGGWDCRHQGASNLDELNARLRETVMVRRLKSEVLKELPAKVRQVVMLDVDDDTAAVVQKELAVFERTEAAVAEASCEMQRAELEGDEDSYKIAVARLRQAQNIAFTEMARVRHEVAVAKLPSVIEHLRETTGKVLVFAWHTDVIEALCEALMKDGHGVVSITGATDKDKRQSIVDAFQRDGNIRFFIGNIKAAGVGLTLTASSHVVFGEIDWTPSSLSQAEDRAHRIGQKDSVLVQHLVFDGSLDAKMAKMLVAKQKVIDQALDAKVELSEKERPVQAALEASAEQVERQGEAKSFSERKAKLDEMAAKLTADQIEAIHEALRIIAAMDCDRALVLNGIGFSKIDTVFGCDLAAKSSLTPRQAAAGLKLVRKYHRQYSKVLHDRIFPEHTVAAD